MIPLLGPDFSHALRVSAAAAAMDLYERVWLYTCMPPASLLAAASSAVAILAMRLLPPPTIAKVTLGALQILHRSAISSLLTFCHVQIHSTGAYSQQV